MYCFIKREYSPNGYENISGTYPNLFLKIFDASSISLINSSSLLSIR
jgi:hypothetical protein